MKLKKRIGTICVNSIAWVISITMLTPFLLIVLNSLKTSLEAAEMSLAFPSLPQFSNFSVVIEKGDMITGFFNSLLFSTFSVLITTLFASMAAYVFARNRRKIHNFFYYFIVLGITMPINFITLVRVMQTLHLMNSRLGIILLYSAIQMPFSLFLIYSFIVKIPRDIDEAGVIDGCSTIQLFTWIVLPLLQPVLITVMVLTFLNTWNEFILPLYMLNNTNYWPMTLTIYKFFGMYHKDWNLMSANIVLTSLPVIIVYLAGQKYIVSGMIAGSVKG